MKLPQPSFFNQTFCIRFLFILIAITSIAGTSSYLFIRQQFFHHQQQNQKTELAYLEHTSDEIKSDLKVVIADALRITNSRLLDDYLSNPNNKTLEHLDHELNNLALYTGMYHQVGLFDKDVNELIGVSYRAGDPIVIQRNNYQYGSIGNLFNNLYSVEPSQRLKNKIYISDFYIDRNTHGREQKPEPIIRVSSPIYRNNELKAVLVLDYFTPHMVKHFRHRIHQESGFLVNGLGDFIYRKNNTNSQPKWSEFELENQRFDKLYPTAWRAMLEQQSGAVLTPEGQFIFVTIDAQQLQSRDLILDESTIKNLWKLISYTSPVDLQFNFFGFIKNNPLKYFFSFSIIAFLSYTLAWLRTQNTLNKYALKRSEENLKKSQKISCIGNWSWDIKTGEIILSDEIYTICKLKPGEISPSYDDFLEFVHPKDRDRVEYQLGRALRNGEQYAIEHRIVLRDRSIRYVREVGAVIFDGDKPTRMVGTVQDVTVTTLIHEHLQKREEEIRSLVEQAPDGIFVADLDGRYTDANPEACRMLGYSTAEIVGKTIYELTPCEETPRLMESKKSMLKGEIEVAEWHLLHKDGHYIPVEVSARILTDGRWQAFARDISDRKKAEAKLRQAAAVIDNTSESIMITDNLTNIITVNKAFTQITGYSEQEALGRVAYFNKSGVHNDVFYTQIWHSLKTTGHWQGEVWYKRKSGSIYPTWETISVVKDHEGNIANYVSLLSDISPVKEAEAKLRHLAHHDPLTGLPNRTSFLVDLERALEHGKRNNNKVALLFLDLDRFKLINDTLGHNIGDELLKEVSARLKQCVRAEDIVTRLGGDEFTIIMGNLVNLEGAAFLAQKIILSISQPFQLAQQEVSTSTSIGISIFPDDAETVSDIVKAADAAMYRAKKRDRGTYEYYTVELTTQSMHRLSLESELRLAIQHDEFVMHYQPQVDVLSGKIVGVEALLRWQHPKRGLLFPKQFIQIAEDSGLINAIGQWVIWQAVKQMRQWQDSGAPYIRMSINMSGRQIMYGQTLETFNEVLSQNGYQDKELPFDLEVTESVLQNGDKALITLEQLRERGIGISIDDFGTGYTSLSQLRHLPVDTLKIDRRFLNRIGSNTENNKAMISAIISFGHSLGLKVISEGVEDVPQFRYLQEVGCDEFQGFLVSQAVSSDAIEAMLIKDQTIFSAINDIERLSLH